MRPLDEKDPTYLRYLGGGKMAIRETRHTWYANEEALQQLRK